MADDTRINTRRFVGGVQKTSNPNVREAADTKSAHARCLVARSNPENRLIFANMSRHAAKALGRPWPVDDEAKQQQVYADYDRALLSGVGIVDTDAQKRVNECMTRLEAAGWNWPPNGH